MRSDSRVPLNGTERHGPRRRRSLHAAEAVSLVLGLCACGAADRERSQQPPAPATAAPTPDGCEAPEPWAGAIQDVDLDEPSSWQLLGGRFDGASRVAFDDAAVCAREASLSQTVDVPDRCAVGGAAVEVSYDVEGGRGAVRYQGALVRLGDRVVDVGAAQTPARLCLGERSFGRSLDVAFAPSAEQACTSSSPPAALGVSVDLFAIVQDESCPAPGEVHTFDAWSTYGDERGVTRVEGSALHLGTRGCSQTVYAEGPPSGALSVPDQKGLALQMNLRGRLAGPTDNGLPPLLLRMNEMFAADLVLGDDVRFCLPDAVRGTVVRLMLRLMSTDCAEQDVFIDGMQIVDDASCGDGLVFDGGFDAAFAGGFDASLNWRPMGNVRVEADEDGDPGAVLRDVALLRTLITVPAATSAGGPALRARVTTSDDSIPQVSGILITLPQVPGAAAGGDGDLLLCLPATRAGQALDVTFAPIARQARLDDVTVGNDARCAGAVDGPVPLAGED